MELITILQKLISIPSVSGQEKEIEQWIYDYLVSLKLHPEWVGPNVVVKISGKDSTKALIFNGHVDTVSPGEISTWQYGPWNPTIVDGKMYGLGTTDMKSGVAVILKLVEKYSLIQPDYDLWFCFVVREETDGSGTGEVMKWFAKHHQKKYKALAGVIGEATENKEIRIAHKGNIFLKVTTHGDTGHGSAPEKIKVHALSKMQKVAKDLNALVASWQKKYGDKLLGVPTVAWTSVQGGDATSPNKIADKCVATFDVRTTPQVHEKALALIQKAFAHKKVTIETMYHPLPYGYTSPEEHIVKLTQGITKAKISISKGSNDILFFTAAKIPAIVFGPGTLGQGHVVNEQVKIEDLEKCFEIYQKIIQNF